jgi:hypothetical protein
VGPKICEEIRTPYHGFCFLMCSDGLEGFFLLAWLCVCLLLEKLLVFQRSRAGKERRVRGYDQVEFSLGMPTGRGVRSSPHAVTPDMGAACPGSTLARLFPSRAGFNFSSLAGHKGEQLAQVHTSSERLLSSDNSHPCSRPASVHSAVIGANSTMTSCRSFA